MSKPNIILITTDQQRFDSLGINGSSFIKTPNLDKIGSDGAVFNRAYCPSPVCTPSRVSLFTGNHLSRHGAYNIGTEIIDQNKMLSKSLKENGYYNYHIGKAHWNPWGEINCETREVDPDGTPFENFMGFHKAEVSIGHGYYGMQKGHYAHWLKERGIQPDKIVFNQLFKDDPMETGDIDIPIDKHSGAWLVDRAKSVLPDLIEKDQPFFLNLGFQDPHHPHVLPKGFNNRVYENDIPPVKYNSNTNGLPEHIQMIQEGSINFSRFVGQFKVAGNGDDANWISYFNDDEKAKKTTSYYYSMIQLLDEQIGDLYQTLEKLGILNNTILIFTSDHGEMLGNHGIGQKGPLIYDEVLKIPLLFHYPKKVKPNVFNECVSLVDILPTVLDYAGISDDVRRDGISLKTILSDCNPLERKGVRIEYKEEADRIRFKCWVNDKYKLAIYPGEEFGELYDLENDPKEENNLFHHELYSSIKAELLLDMFEDMERSEPLSRRPSRV